MMYNLVHIITSICSILTLLQNVLLSCIFLSIAPMDYTAVSLELLFSGPTFHCADITIVNDEAAELTEVFRVVLSSDDPAFAPSVGTALVNIIDDDNREST